VHREREREAYLGRKDCLFTFTEDFVEIYYTEILS